MDNVFTEWKKCEIGEVLKFMRRNGETANQSPQSLKKNNNEWDWKILIYRDSVANFYYRQTKLFRIKTFIFPLKTLY